MLGHDDGLRAMMLFITAHALHEGMRAPLPPVNPAAHDRLSPRVKPSLKRRFSQMHMLKAKHFPFNKQLISHWTSKKNELFARFFRINFGGPDGIQTRIYFKTLEISNGIMPALTQLRTQAQGCNCVLTLVKVVTLLGSV